MNYDFKNLNKTTTAPTDKSIESLTFNGVNLESEIPQFLTINVDGRDSYTRKLSTVDSRSDGDYFLSSKLEKNTITIKYFLRADDTDDFNRAFTRLKYLLQGEEKEFYFADEPEFSRIGTVTKLENSDPGLLSVQGTIEITCSDPYRHGQTKVVNGSNVVYINDPQLLYDQNVDTITVNIDAATNQVVMTIGNDWNMTLNGSFAVGSTLVLDINNRTLTSNGNSVLNTIDITKTNIFEAKIVKGVQVRCSQAAEITVKYRVKLL